MGAAGGGAKTLVSDVFSTTLYTGNNTARTITNGIDLSGKGGLVWIKIRTIAGSHGLYDTTRGATKYLATQNTSAESTLSQGLTAFGSTGFTLGDDNFVNASAGSGGGDYVSWTFREAAKFFDVVTYTGNGSNRTIAHNLGSVPGCIIVKRTDTTGNWQVYHRSLANTEYIVLNSTAAKATGTTRWNSTTPTSTEFSLGTDATVNANAGTYVAYLFAHDAGGFGNSGNDNAISCGSYTGNGSTAGPTVTLGWQPQWLLIKRSSSTGDWNLIDNQRGFVLNGDDAELNANVNLAESTGTFVSPLSTGFQLNTTDAEYNANSSTYIYVAIRDAAA